MPTLQSLSQIRADLKQARAEAMLNEDVATLEESLYEHSSLDSPRADRCRSTAYRMGCPVRVAVSVKRAGRSASPEQ